MTHVEAGDEGDAAEVERVARERYERYRAAGNPGDPWEQLDEWSRDAERAVARHLVREGGGYARGGLIVGPGGEDSVEVRLFEREAIVDRDGRVICRHVGGQLVPEEGEPVIFDAADATWTDGPLRNAKMIVGDFTLRIGEDGTELLVDDDAVVLDLDPAVEEVSGEGYARRSIDWTTVSGDLFVWSDVPVDEDEEGQP